jgi:isopenicillin N synthase-like dioxygenase
VGGGDWKEGYDCGKEVSPSDDEYSASPLIACNNWPSDDIVPGFRAAALAYQRGVQQVGEKILESFAVGLHLPTNYFTSRTQNASMSTLRMLHYPPQHPKKLSEMDRLGCGAHTDYGICTLLWQDDVGGLQVRNSANEWVSVPPIPGSFVVNVGDMMSRWTNGRYASTVHRVVSMSGKERYSVPFFLNPDVKTVVDCLSTCLADGETPRFPPETSETILMRRYQESFTHIVPK